MFQVSVKNIFLVNEKKKLNGFGNLVESLESYENVSMNIKSFYTRFKNDKYFLGIHYINNISGYDILNLNRKVNYPRTLDMQEGSLRFLIVEIVDNSW